VTIIDVAYSLAMFLLSRQMTKKKLLLMFIKKYKINFLKRKRNKRTDGDFLWKRKQAFFFVQNEYE